MRVRLVAILAVVLSALSLPALADRLVVVELFTSQGCSSCPPADALLGDLTEQDGVLPLALHVDYWDYIGWKDDFARPEHTDRQKAYAAAARARTIYTPQMVVGGIDHVVGYKPMLLAKLLMKHAEMQLPADARARRKGDTIAVSVSGQGGPAEVVLVRYLKERSVDIRRGENAGRSLTYHNIVADMSQIGTWDGQGDFAANVDAQGDGAFAILVQKRNGGQIIAAARVP